jgi:hypothetical protein
MPRYNIFSSHETSTVGFEPTIYGVLATRSIPI